MENKLKANLVKNVKKKILAGIAPPLVLSNVEIMDKKFNEIYDKIDTVEQFNKHRNEIFGDQMQNDMKEITRSMKQNLLEKKQPRHMRKKNLGSNEIEFDMTHYHYWTKENMYEFLSKIRVIFYNQPISFQCLKSMAEVEKFI